MPHFRTMLTSEHFCAADLYSEKLEKYVEIIVQIVSVKRDEVVGDKGRKKGMPFITMRSAKTGDIIPKRLGLNATNCETIAAIVGSPDVKKWPDAWITLYVTKTEVGKGMRDCIRIRPEAARPPGKTSSPSDTTKPADPEPTPAAELTDADKRAIEMAEREEQGNG